jgi:hypothetical protein
MTKERDEKAQALKESQAKELAFIREKRTLQEEKEQFNPLSTTNSPSPR